MTDAVKTQTMDRFLGVNNVDDPTRLAPLIVDHGYVYPLQEASNVDIDNTFGISSRSGYDDVFSGTSLHSLWSDNEICLFIDGAVLKKLNTDYTSVTLKTLSRSGVRTSFAVMNDRVYYSNEYDIGYVKANTEYPIPSPGREFKLPLPAGQFIEYYRGCLYVAKDNILYMSDPLCDYFDIRTGYKQFVSRITMLRAIDDGMYVADEKVWWINGKSGDEFERTEAYGHRPVPFTDVKTNGQNFGAGKQGNIAIWTSDNGICVGDNSGNVTNITDDRYAMVTHYQGSGFIRESNNVRHYVNTLY